MSLIPIFVAGALVASTVALVQMAGLSPDRAGFAIIGAALALLALVTGLLLASSTRSQRAKLSREIWSVVRQDLTDLLNILTFRR